MGSFLGAALVCVLLQTYCAQAMYNSQPMRFAPQRNMRQGPPSSMYAPQFPSSGMYGQKFQPMPQPPQYEQQTPQFTHQMSNFPGQFSQAPKLLVAGHFVRDTPENFGSHNREQMMPNARSGPQGIESLMASRPGSGHIRLRQNRQSGPFNPFTSSQERQKGRTPAQFERQQIPTPTLFGQSQRPQIPNPALFNQEEQQWQQNPTAPSFAQQEQQPFNSAQFGQQLMQQTPPGAAQFAQTQQQQNSPQSFAEQQMQVNPLTPQFATPQTQQHSTQYGIKTRGNPNAQLFKEGFEEESNFDNDQYPSYEIEPEVDVDKKPRILKRVHRDAPLENYFKDMPEIELPPAASNKRTPSPQSQFSTPQSQFPTPLSQFSQAAQVPGNVDVSRPNGGAFSALMQMVPTLLNYVQNIDPKTVQDYFSSWKPEKREKIANVLETLKYLITDTLDAEPDRSAVIPQVPAAMMNTAGNIVNNAASAPNSGAKMVDNMENIPGIPKAVPVPTPAVAPAATPSIVSALPIVAPPAVPEAPETVQDIVNSKSNPITNSDNLNKNIKENPTNIPLTLGNGQALKTGLPSTPVATFSPKEDSKVWFDMAEDLETLANEALENHEKEGKTPATPATTASSIPAMPSASTLPTTPASPSTSTLPTTATLPTTSTLPNSPSLPNLANLLIPSTAKPKPTLRIRPSATTKTPQVQNFR